MFLREGKCADITPVDCDFESHNLCGWSTNDEIHQAKSGDQRIFQNKPEDFTTDSLFGHTALFIASQNQAIMWSPIVQPTYHQCLRFAYMKNQDGISFGVDMQRDKGVYQRIHNPSRNLPNNEWHVVQIPVELKIATQFRINITSTNAVHTNAFQVDDIRLMPYCYSNIACNFKDGFCNWRQPNVDDARWKVGSGRTANAVASSTFKVHDDALYVDFSQQKSPTSIARLVSPFMDDFNFYKCARITFQVSEFKAGDHFHIDMLDYNGGRKTLWEYDPKVHEIGAKYGAVPFQVQGMFTEYRFEIVAQSQDAQARIAIFDFNVQNSATDQCGSQKFTPTQAPVTVPPTAPPTRPPATKLDKTELRLVNSLLNNVRLQVANILHTIHDQNDLLYHLVDDVEKDIVKALRETSV